MCEDCKELLAELERTRKERDTFRKERNNFEELLDSESRAERYAGAAHALAYALDAVLYANNDEPNPRDKPCLEL